MDASAYSTRTAPSPGEQAESRLQTRAGELTLRRLATLEDFDKAVELQRVIWGETFKDIVPAAILKVTQKVGGVSAGAFNVDGELFGFVYGITGIYEGRSAHWSHMLGVRPDLRDLGIGQALKEFQRQLLIDAGVEWMYWTFDPLVARNAHLNLNRLGVEVREYVQDMYGDTGSELHAFGTDRFVVGWQVTERVPARRSNGGQVQPARNGGQAPVLNDLSAAELQSLLKAQPPALRIEVPQDIELLSVIEARGWRDTTRRALLAALANGYEVTSFTRADSREFYVLSPSDG